MARIRSVHPSLWTDEDFVQMSVVARLFLIGLWNEADDYGIFEWKPFRLKMRLSPADNIDAASVMEEIKGAGFVVHIERDGKPYGVIKKFRKYQRPQKPSPPIIALDDLIKSIIALVDPSSGNEPVNENSGSPTGIPAQMEDVGCKRDIGIELDNPLAQPLIAASAAPEKIYDLDEIELACREALGNEIAPADPDIGPMALCAGKYTLDAVCTTLESQARKRRRSQVRTWKLWAEIVTEALAKERPPDAPKIVKPPDGSFYAALDSPQWNAWSAHWRKAKGTGPPTDPRGGWRFPSEWPPGFAVPANQPAQHSGAQP